MVKNTSAKRSEEKEIAEAKELLQYWRDVDEQRNERFRVAKAEYENAKKRYFEAQRKYDRAHYDSWVSSSYVMHLEQEFEDLREKYADTVIEKPRRAAAIPHPLLLRAARK